MKKTVLTAALAAMFMIGTLSVSADDNTCATNDSTATSTPWVKKVYNEAKEGTVNTYDKVAEGTVKTYNKVADGTEEVYNKAADGTVNAYDKTKNAVKKGANAVKNEWNKIF